MVGKPFDRLLSGIQRATLSVAKARKQSGMTSNLVGNCGLRPAYMGRIGSCEYDQLLSTHSIFTPFYKCIFTLYRMVVKWCCEVFFPVYFCTMKKAAEPYLQIEARRSDLGLSQAELGRLAFGRAESSVIQNMRRGASPSFDRLKSIADAIGYELYFGPPRETEIPPEAEVEGERFATVARHDAQAAAGGGFINFDGPPIDHLAFSKTWLLQNGIQAGSCSLINATGKSMEPSIYDDDLIMIDHRKKEIRNNRIYVYNDPERGTRVKRFEVPPDGNIIILRSDNPDQKRFPPEYRMGEAMNAISLNIVGEVVWSGHKWV